MSWEDFPEWSRRRRRRFPSFTGGFFEEIDQMMEEMFREMQGSLPKDLFREEKLPDGSIVRRIGPIVYGYSMTMGSDGKPVIREFGNVKSSRRPTAFGRHRSRWEVKGEREPLVDTIVEDDTIKVVAEVPGVEKEDINIECVENTLTIAVDTEKRKYHKVIALPSEVDTEKVKASYRNGVLEITLTKREVASKGHRITID
ncbi:MAG: Hsp20 family protein [Nitrososphaeria archaeon]|nr:Hsp20 family protein [Candidatus Aenigmarchaeota archaeon]NIQ18357.1 Hsp20 family protein [Candidatus Aenigmarchaeota archaeon]NIQ34152.1 Hsp20 family protein [Nitrososphaeria archaeon]NIS73305.1 Hsp20 family protein [Candidatus Aenigmarchaeota archaeon]